eukprot:5865483-Lingulodinium_polyedra.AAC.1
MVGGGKPNLRRPGPYVFRSGLAQPTQQKAKVTNARPVRLSLGPGLAYPTHLRLGTTKPQHSNNHN